MRRLSFVRSLVLGLVLSFSVPLVDAFAQPASAIFPLQLTVDDPIRDNTGTIDVCNMTLLFNNVSGAYEIHLTARPPASFSGDFRININLFNVDADSFVADSVNDYEFSSPTTSVTLKGSRAQFTSWNIGDRIHTNSLAGTPNPFGISLYRSSVMSLPFGFLDNEDYIAFADPALPAIVQATGSVADAHPGCPPRRPLPAHDLAAVNVTYSAFTPGWNSLPDDWEVVPAALIQNLGLTTAKNFSVTFDFGSGTLPQRVMLTELKAGQAVWVTPPRDSIGRGMMLSSGRYTLKVVADAENRITENDEANNVYLVQVLLTSR